MVSQFGNNAPDHSDVAVECTIQSAAGNLSVRDSLCLTTPLVFVPQDEPPKGLR